MRAVEKGLSGLSKQLGWRSEFDLEPLLRAAGLEVVEIRRTHPIGPFTLIDCRNNPQPDRSDCDQRETALVLLSHKPRYMVFEECMAIRMW